MKKILLSILYFFACIGFAHSQTLFGSITSGGTSNAGTLVRFEVPTNTLTVQYNFQGGSDGANPAGTVMQASNGKLYGMTTNGGANNLGVVYSYDISSSTYTKLLDFDGVNGANPQGSLFQAKDGLLYGMTRKGGAGFGVIFSLNPSSAAFTKIKEFTDADGNNPNGSFMQATDGKLYAMTVNGGDYGGGVLFSLDPANATFIKLHDFSGIEGSFPYGNLVQANDGKLYGLTNHGGTGRTIEIPQGGLGVIFSFDPSTLTYAKLKDFQIDGSVPGGYEDGSLPYGSFALANDGKLYGMTFSGGYGLDGTVFFYDPAATVFTKLIYSDVQFAVKSYGSLMQASDGKLYGMAYVSGTGLGSIFSYDIANVAATEIYSFTTGSNGASPYIGAGLIEVRTCTQTTFYHDADGDGYGNPTDSVNACTQPAGYVTNNKDCDDSNKNITLPITYYRDADGDGYGNAASSITNCTKPAGYVTNSTDCNDNNRAIHGPVIYYRDADRDGFGDNNVTISVCNSIAPAGYVKNNYDCDDHKRAANPFLEKLRMCRNGVSDCVYVKDILFKLLQGWRLGTCPGNAIASRSITNDFKSLDEQTPQQYKLSNYPNPFAGKSTIRYELPVDSRVSIKVYDALGRSVATLVDENKKAGSYSVDFNASRLSKGSLYYRLVATSKNDKFEQTNKMIQAQ